MKQLVPASAQQLAEALDTCAAPHIVPVISWEVR